MGIFLGVLAVAAVFAIAAVVVGREARRLATRAPGRVFEFEDAVAWVCDHVEAEVAAVLTPDDVRRILNWHLEFFRIKGVSSNGHTAESDAPVVVSGAGREAVAEHQAGDGRGRRRRRPGQVPRQPQAAGLDHALQCRFTSVGDRQRDKGALVRPLVCFEQTAGKELGGNGLHREGPVPGRSSERWRQ
jgi:hypothetical protein